MPTGEEMRSLTQQIEGAYDARIGDIGRIRKEVSNGRQALKMQLSALDKSHRAMAAKLHADLARGHTALAGSTAAFLKELDTAQQEMAREQKTALGRGRAALATQVTGQLKDLSATRGAMARQQRGNLIKGRFDLATAVINQLKGIHTARKTMANRQKHTLSKGRAELAANTASMIGDMRGDRTAAGAEWRKLGLNLSAKRGGAKQPRSRPSRAPISTPAFGAEMPAGGDSMRPQVFEYLAGHPDGTRMTELEMEFGIPRIQMAKVLKNLMEDSKVEKRDLLYFAV